MIETVYIELPFEKIIYLYRPEFHQEGERYSLVMWFGGPSFK